ncbi:MAG TPA: cytochrome c [Gemmatimonadales bacterium]|jgi:mono/diheme cytochrome c family protein
MHTARCWRTLRAALIAVAACDCAKPMGSGWDWNRMRTMPRAESYGASGFFRDGKAMQLAPAGTVAWAVDSSTAAVDTARGHARFAIYCAVCHGERGDGVSVVASNMDPPRPPSLLTAAIRSLPADRLDSIISSGYGPMPAFGDALDHSDRRAVLAYLSTLQLRAAAATVR